MGKQQKVAVTIEGQLVGYIGQENIPQYLILATKTGEITCKIAKKLRHNFPTYSTFFTQLPIGSTLQAVVKIKKDLQYKIEEIITEQKSHKLPTQAPKKILVCGKSDCQKRGGKGVCQAINTYLQEQGLTQEITIQTTGCMKDCKAGPHIIMPSKKRYSGIKPSAVPTIMMDGKIG